MLREIEITGEKKKFKASIGGIILAQRSDGTTSVLMIVEGDSNNQDTCKLINLRTGLNFRQALYSVEALINAQNIDDLWLNVFDFVPNDFESVQYLGLECKMKLNLS